MKANRKSLRRSSRSWLLGIISIFGLLWMLAVGTFWFVLPILGILVLWKLFWYVWGV